MVGRAAGLERHGSTPAKSQQTRENDKAATPLIEQASRLRSFTPVVIKWFPSLPSKGVSLPVGRFACTTDGRPNRPADWTTTQSVDRTNSSGPPSRYSLPVQCEQRRTIDESFITGQLTAGIDVNDVHTRRRDDHIRIVPPTYSYVPHADLRIGIRNPAILGDLELHIPDLQKPPKIPTEVSFPVILPPLPGSW